MTNIFVGNLSFGTTSADLEATFAAFGTVQRASVVSDRETGQSRGFGFVEMTNEAEASTAISVLNGQEINGRALNVNEARPRESNGGGGGYNRNSGGGGRSRGPRENRW